MPRCADPSCGRWRPERLAPKWASGLRFNGGWYCSRDCVENAARAGLDRPAGRHTRVALPPLRLGVLLRHLGALTEDALARALQSQKASGLRLGAELQRIGVVSGEAVLKCLAAQSNVSYLASFDLASVTSGPSWLPGETVRALGLIPFALNQAERTVRVACAAPVPRAAMRALLKLTDWTPEPYLVEDAVWARAMQAYESAPEGGTVHDGAVEVPSVAAAATRIADTAQIDRAITMRHATYDRYMWVRVEGSHRVSDLLVAPNLEEDECQAERTAH